jgi:hypothetical protein
MPDDLLAELDKLDDGRNRGGQLILTDDGAGSFTTFAAVTLPATTVWPPLRRPG